MLAAQVLRGDDGSACRAGRIAQPYLSQIETGKRDGTAQTMKKLALALDVTVDDLI